MTIINKRVPFLQNVPAVTYRDFPVNAELFPVCRDRTKFLNDQTFHGKKLVDVKKYFEVVSKRPNVEWYGIESIEKIQARCFKLFAKSCFG